MLASQAPYQYEAFRVDATGDIIEQVKEVLSLPPHIQKALNDREAGYVYRDPETGEAYARYFDYMIVDKEKNVIAAFRRDRPDPGTHIPKLNVFPEEFKTWEPVTYNLMRRTDGDFPASADSIPVQGKAYDGLVEMKERLRQRGVNEPMWFDIDPSSGYHRAWRGGRDVLFYLLGVRYVLKPDDSGFIIDRINFDKATPQNYSSTGYQFIAGTNAVFGVSMLPGLSDATERLELIYQHGGIMRPEKARWEEIRQRLGGDWFRAAFGGYSDSDRPLALEHGLEASHSLDEALNARLGVLKERQAQAKDPKKFEEIGQEIDRIARERWWLDDDGYIYVIVTSPEDMLKEARELDKAAENMKDLIANLETAVKAYRGVKPSETVASTPSPATPFPAEAVKQPAAPVIAMPSAEPKAAETPAEIAPVALERKTMEPKAPEIAAPVAAMPKTPAELRIEPLKIKEPAVSAQPSLAHIQALEPAKQEPLSAAPPTITAPKSAKMPAETVNVYPVTIERKQAETKVTEAAAPAAAMPKAAPARLPAPAEPSYAEPKKDASKASEGKPEARSAEAVPSVPQSALEPAKQEPEPAAPAIVPPKAPEIPVEPIKVSPAPVEKKTTEAKAPEVTAPAAAMPKAAPAALPAPVKPSYAEPKKDASKASEGKPEAPKTSAGGRKPGFAVITTFIEGARKSVNGFDFNKLRDRLNETTLRAELMVKALSLQLRERRDVAASVYEREEAQIDRSYKKALAERKRIVEAVRRDEERHKGEGSVMRTKKGFKYEPPKGESAIKVVYKRQTGGGVIGKVKAEYAELPNAGSPDTVYDPETEYFLQVNGKVVESDPIRDRETFRKAIAQYEGIEAARRTLGNENFEDLSFNDFVRVYMNQNLSSRIGEEDYRIANLMIKHVRFVHSGPRLTVSGGSGGAAIGLEIAFDSSTRANMAEEAKKAFSKNIRLQVMLTDLAKEAATYYIQLERAKQSFNRTGLALDEMRERVIGDNEAAELPVALDAPENL
jgi:hypothetical protein